MISVGDRAPLTSFVGAYVSYFLDGATGGVIVTLQTLMFLAAFLFAPKHGVAGGAPQVAGLRRPPRERGHAASDLLDFVAVPL